MKSLECHVGGQPVRVIVEGVPSPQGRTQAQKAVVRAPRTGIAAASCCRRADTWT
jgi:proline racemase